MSDFNDYYDAFQHGHINKAQWDSLHCVHGTFIGDPNGPDYLCGDCELGTPDTELDPHAEARMVRSQLYRCLFRRLIDESYNIQLNTPEFFAVMNRSARMITAIKRWTDDPMVCDHVPGAHSKEANCTNPHCENQNHSHAAIH